MRNEFAKELRDFMFHNEDAYLILADVGYGIFDIHRAEFPSRVINVGAAEYAALCIAVGLAIEGKISFIYTITPFLLWRGAEVIRNYINHEEIPVKMIGSGRDNDYEKDGFSHCAKDDLDLLQAVFYNIKIYRPEIKESIPLVFRNMVRDKLPCYLNLRR
jgi:transketolase